MSDVSVIVRSSIGFEAETCHGCGEFHKEFTELHLRHIGKKIVLCGKCDDRQASAPRLVK